MIDRLPPKEFGLIAALLLFILVLIGSFCGAR